MEITLLSMADKAYLAKCKSLIDNNVPGWPLLIYTPHDIDNMDIIAGVGWRKMSKKKFYWEMQRMKFEIMLWNLHPDRNDNLAFLDMDTFIVKDFSHIFKQDFDVAITIRKDMIDKGCLRAYANGGVIFAKNTIGAYNFFRYALSVIDGYDELGGFYNEVWKSLEEGRKPEKTHWRYNKRWWVDQVFLSSVVLFLQCEKKSLYTDIVYQSYGFKILLLDCEEYNQLEVTEDTMRGMPYIGHLKTKANIKGMKD